MKRIPFALAVVGLLSAYALARPGPPSPELTTSQFPTSNGGDTPAITGRHDTSWRERVAPFASDCTSSSSGDGGIPGSVQDENRHAFKSGGPSGSFSLIPPAAPDPAYIDALARDPLAQESLRRIAEANDEVQYNPLPDWPPALEDFLPPGSPRLRAEAVYVVNHDSGDVLLARQASTPYPIASIAKLMGAIIYADTYSDPDEVLTILWEDKYLPMVTRSKLRLDGCYRAGDLLYQTLLSSDNRAMMALMRQTRLPLEVIRDAMNARSQALGLSFTHFEEPTGLDPGNISTAREIALLLEAALSHPVLNPVLTTKRYYYSRLDKNVTIGAHATNKLAFEPAWDIVASKTGYTIMSGSCLVTKTHLNDGRTVTISILGARGTDGRYPVAEAIRRYLEKSP